MKKIKIISFILFGSLIGSIHACFAIQTKFILIIPLYNETKKNRAKEYTACLKKNLENELIEHIHIVYDTSNNTDYDSIADYLKNPKVTFNTVFGRQSYDYFFKLANKNYPNKKIILSNADIFFNKTLTYLNDYNFKNNLLALTRWNVQNDGSLEIFKQFDKNGYYHKENSARSQDTWIFETPIKNFACDDIKLGIMGCDSAIAYRALKAGLTVKNPCLTIQCCHLHLSEKKDYAAEPNPYWGQPRAAIPWEIL